MNLAGFLHFMNGLQVLLDLSIVAFLVFYLSIEWIQQRFTFRHWFTGNLPLGVQAAIAIFIFLSGDAMFRGSIWFIRNEVGITTGLALVDWTMAGPFVLIGAAVSVIGLLCKMRTFTRGWLGDWPWLTGGALAFAAALIFTIYRI